MGRKRGREVRSEKQLSVARSRRYEGGRWRSSSGLRRKAELDFQSWKAARVMYRHPIDGEDKEEDA